MTQNQIITVTARKNMVRARAGEIQLPKIVGFVFGDGGVDESGNIIPLSETDSTLGNELLRKKYDSYTMVSDTAVLPHVGCRSLLQDDSNADFWITGELR